MFVVVVGVVVVRKAVAVAEGRRTELLGRTGDQHAASGTEIKNTYSRWSPPILDENS